MKINILLQLEVDIKGACGQDETEVTANAKIRHYISELVGCGLLKIPSISLCSSAAMEEIDLGGVFRMIETPRVVRLTNEQLREFNDN